MFFSKSVKLDKWQLQEKYKNISLLISLLHIFIVFIPYEAIKYKVDKFIKYYQNFENLLTPLQILHG